MTIMELTSQDLYSKRVFGWHDQADHEGPEKGMDVDRVGGESGHEDDDEDDVDVGLFYAFPIVVTMRGIQVRIDQIKMVATLQRLFQQIGSKELRLESQS